MPKQFMRVIESFSGTLEVKRGREVERTPVTLNKGQTFQSDHRYVKTWPHHFEPLPEKAEV